METFGASKEFLFDSETPWETVAEGVQRQIMGYDDKIMLVKAKFETGGIGQMHEHYHSQVTYVVDGAFELTIGEVTKMVKGGDSFYIPPHVMHGAICREAGLLIDVFSPIREDFMEK
ncbi:cupin domain-containing protein [Wenyingzhuangia sp. 2_MG-2023]|uniref:cupin domain-containing protein n=1 Tax=Wenyingzhuangia sp. 2_MG-2023 TaxID=3062639 RepID=UPI0026E1B7E9|nr:cupin domain-containing protein [Wenyingzhuangia sp. 2_MG-2023]MDO6738420.1 cupin domain-containing protein [Wenyingzhuangia sp. 2_MG-2023]MDO6803357.1 cupin domain-containing protein [Wenyingzhuangia sp. 1_MG-2023]